MKQKFSGRMDITKPLSIQIDDMRDELRNSIWNFILDVVDEPSSTAMTKSKKDLFADGFFKVPKDQVPTYPRDRFWGWARDRYKALSWYEVYDLLEFVVENCELLSDSIENRDDLFAMVNWVLQRENSGFRFIQGVLSPISSEAEVATIEQAVIGAHKAGLDGVRTHLITALQLLGQKPEPDFRNSIKEAVSAVESAAKCIGGVQGGGLDAALKVLAEKADLHPALVKGFNALYGYSSNEGGIRHAILEEKKVGYDEAKFMLVACSAFVHFLISKAEAAGVLKQGR